MLWKFITERKELDSYNHMHSCHFLLTDRLEILVSGKALQNLVTVCLFPLVIWYNSSENTIVYIFTPANHSDCGASDPSLSEWILPSRLEQSWIVDPDQDHPKVTHPQGWFSLATESWSES